MSGEEVPDVTSRPLHPAAAEDPDRTPPALPRHQAPGGWRRAVVGAVLGGVLAAVCLRWLQPDGPGPGGSAGP